MAASFESFIVKDGSNENDGGKQQRQLPCILSPPQSSSTISSAQDTSNFIKENRQKIDQSLQEHGAVLFRGFPLKDVQDFDMFVSSWEDWQDLSYDRSMSFAVRHKLSNRICTTNEGKVRKKRKMQGTSLGTVLILVGDCVLFTVRRVSISS